MKQFEVGKRYRYVDGRSRAKGCHLTGENFICTMVDTDGDCWSVDATFGGRAPRPEQGWFVASGFQLNNNTVVEA